MNNHLDADRAPLAPLLVPPRLRSTWRYGRVPLIEPLLGARIVPREWPLGGVDGVIGWGRKVTGERAQALARRLGLPCLLAEDGFLRSIGLGHAEAALSIVLDDVGVHYDARSPSRLEALVRAGHGAAQRERALRLAAAWRAGRVSKYNHVHNTGALKWGESCLSNVLFPDCLGPRRMMAFSSASFSCILAAILLRIIISAIIIAKIIQILRLYSQNSHKFRG